MVCGRLVLVVVGSILLLIGPKCTRTQAEDDYAVIADLDCCFQSCPSTCEEAEDPDAVCRCDSECERHGDCCSQPSATSRLICGGDPPELPLAGLQCRSIHLDPRTQPGRMEAFWMVSECPEDWLANQDDGVLREVDEKCSNGSDTLPPVTDLDGGVVYKNEYCAVCHQVTNVQPWRYRFGCSPCLENRITTQGINLTQELIEQECIACGFQVPQTGPPPRRCLHPSLMVDTCQPIEAIELRTDLRWEGEVYRNIVTRCQNGPVRPVAEYPCNVPFVYRNQYCAICNAQKTTDLVCSNPYYSRRLDDYCLEGATLCGLLEDDRPPNISRRDAGASDQTSGSGNGSAPTPPTSCILSPIEYASFTLFFDVTGDSGVITSDIVSSNITTTCSSGKVFDPIDQTCRQTVCTEGFATLRGSCAIVPSLANNTNDSSIMCNKGLIVLRESEFELLDNDTLLFRNDTFEIIGYNDSSPIICSNFSQNGTSIQQMTVVNYSYPPIFSILTYVGCLLSIAGCVSVLLTYSLFKELRTLPGQILMNLVSTILATSLFILIGIPVAVLVEKDELCEATAIFLHWLILSQFSWMSIMSFELLRTFYRASRLYPVEDKSTKNKIFLLYLLIGWGTPFLITLITVIVNYSSDVIQYGRDGFCWIGHVPSFYVVFVTPVALSIVFNGITFVVTFSLLFKSSRAQKKIKNQQNTSYLRVYIGVFSITGLTWIFGFLAILIGDDWAWYVFIILTSTQGLVICAAFIFTQKIGSLYKHLLIPSKPMTTSKSNLKHRDPPNTKSSGNDSTVSTKSTLPQCDAQPPKGSTEESSGEVSFEVDTTQEP